MKLWQLQLMDDTTIEMPESAAVLVKSALARGDKFLSLPDRTVASHQIKTLDKTSKEDVDSKKLLEGGISAFAGQVNVLTDDKGYTYVPSIRVKKEVSQRDYSNYYSKHPSYKKENEDGFVVSFTIAKDLGIPQGCQLV